MKFFKAIFVLLLIGVAVVVAYQLGRQSPAGVGLTQGPGGTSPVDQSLQLAKQDATNAWENVKQTTTNAWNSVKASVQSAADYTYDNKDQYIAQARADLDSLDEKIKEWADKAAHATASAKDEAQAKLASLRDQRSTLNQKLAAVKNSTAANWQEVKAGFQDSCDKTKESVKDAWNWLNAKLGS